MLGATGTILDYILFAILFSLVVYNFLKKKHQKRELAQVDLYYASSDDVCKRLLLWLDAHPKRSAKFVIHKKDVDHSPKSKKEVIGHLKRCNIKEENTLPLPVLWLGGECIYGEEDVIRYFS